MNPNDVVTMSMTTKGADKVEGDILKIKQAIYELQKQNDTLRDGIKQKAGELEKARKELNSYTKDIEANEKTINKNIVANEKIQEKLDMLEASGKKGGSQWNKYNDQLLQNNKTIESLRKEVESLTRSQVSAEKNLAGLQIVQKGYKEELRSNNEEIRKQKELQKQVSDSLPLSHKSYSQLIKTQKQLRKELNSTSKSLEPEKWNKLKKELDAVDAQMSKVAIGAENVSKGLSVMGVSVGVLAGNLMTKAVDKLREWAQAAKEWVLEGINIASASEGVTRAFEKLNKPGLLDNLRKQTRGVISDFDLMQAAVRADKYKIPIDNVGNLLEFARRRAIDMGKNVDDFQKRIIDGIGRQSKLMLDDLGLSSAEISKEVAKSGSFAQGIINIVNKEIEKQGDIALTAADKKVQAEVKWRNAQENVGSKLLFIQNIWSKLTGSVADGITDFANNKLPALIAELQNIINLFIDMYNSSVGVRMGIQSLWAVSKNFFDFFKVNLKNSIALFIYFIQSINAGLKFDFKEMGKAFADFNNRLINNAKIFKDDIKNNFKEISEVVNKYIEPVDFTSTVTTNNTVITNNDDNYDPETAKKQKQALDLLLEELEIKHRRRLAEINQDYLDGKIKTEAGYNRLLFAQEQSYNLLREEALTEFLKNVTDKALASDVNKQIAAINEKQLQQQIKYQSQLEKILLDADPLKKEKQAYEERLAALGLFGETSKNVQLAMAAAESDEEKKILKQKLEALLILEQQYQDNVAKIRKAGKAKDKADAEASFEESFAPERQKMQLELNKLMTDAASLSGGAAYDAEMEVHKKKLEMIQAELNARIAFGADIGNLFEKQGKEEAGLTSTMRKESARRTELLTRYSGQLGTAMGEFFSGQKTMLEAFGSSLIDITFDVLTNIINTKIIETTGVAVAEQAKATVISMSMPDSVATFGAAGGARAAVMSALIMGALQMAKTALKGMISNKSSSSSSSSSDSGSNFSGSIRVKGKEEGGHIDVIREQDGKPFSASYAPGKRGFVSRPTVIVGEGPAGKSMEWVASNALVNNPTARPIIDLFDRAQRSGRVGTIDMNQLMRSRLAGFASGGFVAGGNSAAPANSAANVPVIYNNSPSVVDIEMLKLLQKLNKGGIKATTFLGMSELDAQQKSYLREQNRFAKKG